MFQTTLSNIYKILSKSYKNQIKAIKYSEIRSSWMNQGDFFLNQCEYFRKWSDWKCKAVELKMPDSMWRWGKLGACAPVVKQTLHSICFFLRGWCEPSEHLQTRDAQSHIEIALHRMRISERDGAKEYTQHRICLWCPYYKGEHTVLAKRKSLQHCPAHAFCTFSDLHPRASISLLAKWTRLQTWRHRLMYCTTISQFWNRCQLLRSLQHLLTCTHNILSFCLGGLYMVGSPNT